MTILRLESAWLPTRDACARLGVTRRTLQRWAKAGRIDSRDDNGHTVYRVTPDHASPARDTGPVSQARRTTHATRDTAPIVAELRELLDASNRARIDAERRAATAEYRADLAETEPETVAELREQVERLTRERDEAREHAHRLADAMRKRHALIRRILASR